MRADIIAFDCDSTLSSIEGIDELGKRAGVGDELARLTDAAMNGELPLAAVYEQRLLRIKPSQADITWLAACYLAQQVVGVAETFAYLLAQGKQIHIISGGLRPAILPLAHFLGVAEQQVHAVDVYFNADGSYRDYQQDSPLARNGGKAEICQQLCREGQSLIMVGDGQTDMEAQQAGAFTIGFGGVIARASVQACADVFVTEADLRAVLAYIE